MSQPDPVEQFAEKFEKELQTSQTEAFATEKWTTLQDTMYRTALAAFGKKTHKCIDWFKAKSAKMTPVIEAKRAALPGVQAYAQREKIADPQNCQEQSSGDCQTLR